MDDSITIVIYATSESSNTFFYEKKNLPLERSECANPPSKKNDYTLRLLLVLIMQVVRSLLVYVVL
jgi:hypothetical protein